MESHLQCPPMPKSGMRIYVLSASNPWRCGNWSGKTGWSRCCPGAPLFSGLWGPWPPSASSWPCWFRRCLRSTGTPAPQALPPLSLRASRPRVLASLRRCGVRRSNRSTGPICRRAAAPHPAHAGDPIGLLKWIPGQTGEDPHDYEARNVCLRKCLTRANSSMRDCERLA